MITLNNIHKRYQLADRAVPVLKNIHLAIHDSDCLAIVGRSGSGKSTLLNILGLLDSPTSGEYLFDGQSALSLSADLSANLRNQHIGFVFQQFHLLPRLTVLDNVILPLMYGKARSKADMHEKALFFLERVGIAEKACDYPNQLSGGQQQRVAIARALINDPRLILADEPTGALDSKTSAEMMDLFFTLRSKASLVIVTHDLKIASLCQRQVTIVDGEISV